MHSSWQSRGSSYSWLDVLEKEILLLKNKGMWNFNLSTNYAKPGDVVQIEGSCIAWLTTFSSSDENVAVISSGNTVSAVWIGESTIKEDTILWLGCENSTGVILTSTEDGKPFFMSKADYNTWTNYELVFVMSLLFVAFLIRFAKKS